jgi:hypothetical protein
VKRLALFDAALPGIPPPPPAGIPSAEANVKTWHLAFNRLDDLPEILLRGREGELLTWLFRAKFTRPWTITPSDFGEYARVNAAPGATRAALSLPETQSRAPKELRTPRRAPSASSPCRYSLSARRAESVPCCWRRCA